MEESAFAEEEAAAPETYADATEPSPPTAEVALAHLDEAATALQREGRFLEALECMERGLVLRQRYYGVKSPEVFASCKAAGELCNLLAMTFLQKEDYPMATELLKKAEILTENEPGGRAVTYNNLACFARQQGRLHAALAFLQKALRIEETLARVENPADTHLNLCAVLSQLGKHPEALQHGIAALTLLQDELFSDATAASSAAQKPDRVAVLAICYHNIGVEYEFLKDWEAAAQAYTKGVEIGSVYLGPQHGITQTLTASQDAAHQAMADAKAKAARQAALIASKMAAMATPSRVVPPAPVRPVKVAGPGLRSPPARSPSPARAAPRRQLGARV